MEEEDWQGDSSTWVLKTISVTGIDYTIPAGNELEVKLICPSESDDDMWFAYDTTDYVSRVELP